MTRDRLPLTTSVVALALALSGCATTRTGESGVAEAAGADAPASAIKGTRVVSTATGLSRSEDPLALRVPARVMRIWIAPWEDSRGDLHAPGYRYTEIEPRRWTLGGPADRDKEIRIRPLQIERRDAQPNTSRSGRASHGKARRNPGRTRGKAAVPETGPNLLGS